MPRINLLPWREELRKQRQQEFVIMAVVAMALMGVVVFGVHLYIQQLTDFQQERNDYLTSETAKLDKKIEEIKDLDREKERLLARMNIIQQLQSSRPEIVHIVDSLVQTLPEGVYYKKITQKANILSMEGDAQSNARVSSLMRNLESSIWFENPNLVEIKAAVIVAGTTPDLTIEARLSSFKLTVTLTKQKKKSEGEEEAKKS
jgi:type IV pilus assembly protein PilN